MILHKVSKVSCADFYGKFQTVFGAVCVGSVYWTCVTYGAVTLMQVIGHDRGLVLMERTDPLLLLVALPLVPVGLVLGKMIRWEEPVIHEPYLSCLRTNGEVYSKKFMQHMSCSGLFP
jgi:vancomycin permeability regulator SanA